MAEQTRLTRRQLVAQGLTGIGLAGTLAACGSSLASVRPTATPIPTPTPQPPTPTATPDLRPISLILTGDIMLGRSVNTAMVAAGNDGLFPFAQTADLLRSYDVRVGNLECVVSKLGSPVPKDFTFEADLIGLHRLQQVGFDVVSVANNHSGDYGPVAFADMLGNLPSFGVAAMGGGLNATAAHTPLVIERHGNTIAFVAACDIAPESFAATDSSPGDAWLTADALNQDVPRARQMADFVIVFTHWGVEYQPDYDTDQQQLAHLAIDLGADLVCGMHPHVIQGNEIYKDKLIVYSLGNFVFDEMYGDTSHGNLLSLTIERNRRVDWKLIPITIDTSTGAPYLA